MKTKMLFLIVILLAIPVFAHADIYYLCKDTKLQSATIAWQDIGVCPGRNLRREAIRMFCAESPVDCEEFKRNVKCEWVQVEVTK